MPRYYRTEMDRFEGEIRKNPDYYALSIFIPQYGSVMIDPEINKYEDALSLARLFAPQARCVLIYAIKDEHHALVSTMNSKFELREVSPNTVETYRPKQDSRMLVDD